MKSASKPTIIILAMLFAAVAGYLLGTRQVSTVIVQEKYVYLPMSEIVEVQNRLYSGTASRYRESSANRYCDVPIYGGTLQDLPEDLQKELPTLCEMRNVTLLMDSQGRVYAHLQRFGLSIDRSEEYLRNIFRFENMYDERIQSFSFEGNQSPDSTTFENIGVRDALEMTYGEDGPESSIRSVGFELSY